VPDANCAVILGFTVAAAPLFSIVIEAAASFFFSDQQSIILFSESKHEKQKLSAGALRWVVLIAKSN
jgi:hypothetical protein